MDKHSGEVVCSHCGLVISDLLFDHQPEWRAFTLEERDAKIRIGAPISLIRYDKGLPTTFQPYKDSAGKALSLDKRLQMTRLRKWDFRARMHSSVERNLSQAMNVIQRVSDQLSLPKDVNENAALIYRRALHKDLVKGRCIRAIAAASLYAACRLLGIPRSLQAIVKASTRTRKEISRCYRLLQYELNITMPIDDPIKFIPMIASKTKVHPRTQNTAIELLQHARERKAFTGKSPAGLAAAALYIASIQCGEKVTQKKLAQAANVTEVTVRNRYKWLKKDLGLTHHEKREFDNNRRFNHCIHPEV